MSRIFLLFLISFSYLNASENKYCWIADSPNNSGVLVDEEIKTLVSVYRSFVFFDDRVSIRNAVAVAEEGAKNQIIRFIAQKQYTEREIINKNEKSSSRTMLTDGSGNENTNKITMEMSQIINEYTKSTANEILRGVEKIEESYNKDLLEVCVAMSISARSKNITNQINQW